MKWLNVKTIKPKCSRDKDALGVSVLVWPRNPGGGLDAVDGHAYFGRRATGQPAFYKYGVEIFGVTHWMPMPAGPKTKKPEEKP